MDKKTTRYGPRKLGEKAFAEQEESRELESRSGTVYGPRKGGSGGQDIGATLDVRTHELAVGPAGKLIAGIEDTAELDALALGEQAHPKYDGGRAGVLDAITARQEELAEAAGGEDGDTGTEGSQEGQEAGEGQPPADEGDEPRTPKALFVAAAESDDNDYINLDEMRAALEANPALLDGAVAYEFEGGKPRDGALELFVELENAREGGPREKRLELYRTHLES